MRRHVNGIRAQQFYRTVQVRLLYHQQPCPCPAATSHLVMWSVLPTGKRKAQRTGAKAEPSEHPTQAACSREDAKGEALGRDSVPDRRCHIEVNTWGGHLQYICLCPFLHHHMCQQAYCAQSCLHAQRASTGGVPVWLPKSPPGRRPERPGSPRADVAAFCAFMNVWALGTLRAGLTPQQQAQASSSTMRVRVLSRACCWWCPVTPPLRHTVLARTPAQCLERVLSGPAAVAAHSRASRIRHQACRGGYACRQTLRAWQRSAHMQMRAAGACPPPLCRCWAVQYARNILGAPRASRLMPTMVLTSRTRGE